MTSKHRNDLGSGARAAAADRDRFFALSVDLMCVARMRDGFITRLNPAFERTLGYTDAELLSQPFLQVIHPDDRERTLEALRRLEQGALVLDFEVRCRHKDGTYRLLSWRAVAEPERGTFYAIGRDVTDRKALEAQLRHSQKMDAIGRLAGGVAHDFNNLLLAVLGNVDFARTEPDPGHRCEYLDEATRAARRATELTRQLLTLSRRQPLHRASLDLNEVVQGTVKLLRRLIPAHIEVDVIPGHALAHVSADRAQLEQVILNLALNARDAMPAGGRLVLETENVLVNGSYKKTHPWARPGRYVLLTVTDSGTGMTPDVQERVFEPFFTTKAPGEGTGLGLATVYAIVEQHGGMLHLYSEVDHGTTFKVYLPATERLAERVGPKLDARVQGGSETLLVAEDEAIVRHVVVKILEDAGYRVLTATNGAEAVSVFQEHRDAIDLVLLDLVMPKQNGLETWEQIRAIRPDVRVLFTSGYSDVHRIGPEHQLLQKPYEPDLMLRRIRGLLDAERRTET
jgi:PAS domain S-box-containing protein